MPKGCGPESFTVRSVADRYEGQCLGGPDNGNLVSSRNPNFKFQVVYIYFLDGPDSPPSTYLVQDRYRWDASRGVFTWELMRGQDGYTKTRGYSARIQVRSADG